MDDETAMSPLPCLATTTDDSKSGTDLRADRGSTPTQSGVRGAGARVPAARNVSAMMNTGTPICRPMISMPSTMSHANAPIHAIETRNVA
mgnify:CR=1 FL=1